MVQRRARAERSEARRRLTRADWVAAALAAIADGGLAEVAVEPLAARLGTTKGSFYWHFPNRAALLDAAIAQWDDLHTAGVIAEVDAASDDPLAQLRLLFKRVTEMAERDRVGLALLADADHPAVAAVLTGVTERRIAYVASLFAKLGFAPAEARRRGLLAYSAYLGQTQLARAAPRVLPRDPAAQRAYLDHVLDALARRPGGPG